MTIADTSVWVEFLRNREPVHARLKTLLERGEVLGVECVFGELFSGARSPRESVLLESYWKSLPRMEEAGIWVEAGRLDASRPLRAHGVGLVDAAILAAASRARADIWTLDRRLREACQREKDYPGSPRSASLKIRLPTVPR
ncbi:MAG: PIN domain-containing protein [Spirochaetia bacterium]